MIIQVKQSNTGQSRNYSLVEYCEDIVETIKGTLDNENLPHPVIVTESGRATVAYTSILLFNILDVVNFDPQTLPETIDGEHQLLNNMREIFQLLKAAKITGVLQ